ncbi:MAG: HDOD domain-containing protein [Methylococcaceae bacterium]|nr:MAG: HDOD domain-containing protein [Methylococcaceae bacterium]
MGFFAKLFSSQSQTQTPAPKPSPTAAVAVAPENPPSPAPAPLHSPPSAPVKDLGDADRQVLANSFSDLLLDAGAQNKLPPNEAERSIIRELEQLMVGDIPDSAVPRLPEVAMVLMKELADENVSQERILDQMKHDPAIASEVLRMSNSPLFHVGHEQVENLDRAVQLLGFNTLRTVINAVLLKRMMNIPPIYFKMYGQYLWKHSVDCAQACQALSKQSGVADPFNAYIVGLLHDVGKLVIFRLLIDTLRKNPDLNPRGGVFSKIVSENSMRLSVKLARQWDMPHYLLQAFEEQIGEKPYAECSAYGFILKQANTVAEFKLIAEMTAKNQAKLDELIEQYCIPLYLLQTAFPKETAALLALPEA